MLNVVSYRTTNMATVGFFVCPYDTNVAHLYKIHFSLLPTHYSGFNTETNIFQYSFSDTKVPELKLWSTYKFNNKLKPVKALRSPHTNKTVT